MVGENGAGKSTLMNILGGEYHPDDGSYPLEGKPIPIPSPYASRRIGISIVYQELKLCPNLTVVENIFLGQGEGGKRQEGELEEAQRQRRRRSSKSLGAPHLSPRARRAAFHLRAAAGRDREGDQHEQQDPDTRRAHLRPDPQGGRAALQEPALPQGTESGHHHLHLPPAGGSVRYQRQDHRCSGTGSTSGPSKPTR